MARNEEKAQSMLYRFRQQELIEAGLIRPKYEQRPTSTATVTEVKDAEHWRGRVIKEISGKVSRIQNPGLNSYEIRELNDSINTLIKEKSRWEYRIKELGGRNYMKRLDSEGISITRGYKYFGQARNLPGVKELLEYKEEKEEHKPAKLEKKILDEDYYGYHDEENNTELLKIEAEAEESARAVAMNEWNAIKIAREQHKDASAPSQENLEAAKLTTPTYIPSQDEVRDYLLQRFHTRIEPDPIEN